LICDKNFSSGFATESLDEKSSINCYFEGLK